MSRGILGQLSICVTTKIFQISQSNENLLVYFHRNMCVNVVCINDMTNIGFQVYYGS